MWIKNREFLTTIPEEHHKWAITVAFYTAMHAAEVLFAFNKSNTHTNHSQREFTLGFSLYDPIRDHYHVLKNLSRLSRYDCYPSLIFRIEDIQTLIKNNLWSIELYVSSKVYNNEHIDIDKIEWPPD